MDFDLCGRIDFEANATAVTTTRVRNHSALPLTDPHSAAQPFAAESFRDAEFAARGYHGRIQR